MQKNLLFFIIFLIFPSFFGFSHPHLWFTSSVEFSFAENSLQGAYVEWAFDRYFSADIIYGYDLDKNGVFNAAETADVYENAFSYTKNYYYFIFMRQGELRVSPDKVSKFSVRQENGIVIYRFYIDLSQFKGKERELYFAVYDYTFFCDITYPKNGITFSGTGSKICPVYSIEENKRYPVYYNPVGSIDDSRVYYKWKPGLETYYPKEIKVRY